jgi:hypothetical protein
MASDSYGDAMDWKLIVAIIAAGSIGIMIVSMIVGSVRSTRGGLDWDHTTDRNFRPWDDDDH